MTNLMKGAVFIAGLAVAATAGARDYTKNSNAAGIRVGTTGAGLELTLPVNQVWHFRVFGGGGLSGERTEDAAGIDYDVEAKLGGAGVMVDVHPFKNGFRASAGAVYNANTLEAESGSCDAPIGGLRFYEIGGRQYQGGFCIEGDGDFNPVAPMVSLGWDSSLYNRSGWSFTVELGAIFQGDARIDLKSSGSATDVTGGGATVIDTATDPTFQAGLRETEAELDRELDGLKIFPMAHVGLSWRF